MLRILTSFPRAGKNVWQFLAEYADITVYMTEKNLDTFYMCPDSDIMLNEVLYTKEERAALHQAAFELEQKQFLLTKETEQAAYERYAKYKDKQILRRYPQSIYYGVLYEPKENRLTFYPKELAVEKFHAWCGTCLPAAVEL